MCFSEQINKPSILEILRIKYINFLIPYFLDITVKAFEQWRLVAKVSGGAASEIIEQCF